MRKKILAVALACFAGISVLGGNSIAATGDNQVMPCGSECPSCGNFSMHSTLTGTQEEHPVQIDCIHGYENGYDIRYEKVNIYMNKCTDCGYYYTHTSRVGYTYSCNGY